MLRYNDFSVGKNGARMDMLDVELAPFTCCSFFEDQDGSSSG